MNIETLIATAALVPLTGVAIGLITWAYVSAPTPQLPPLFHSPSVRDSESPLPPVGTLGNGLSWSPDRPDISSDQTDVTTERAAASKADWQ